MSGTDLVLHLVVGFASFCQAVTGIGFGMIAGPIILMAVGDHSAIIVSTLMSWLIAAALAPALWRGADRVMLRRLCVGAALGLPAGAWLFAVTGIELLQVLAGAVVGLMTLMIVFGAPAVGRPGTKLDLLYGALGGCFGGCLSMPGPTAAVRLTALGHGKVVVRSTMIAFFVVIWPFIFLAQALGAGLSGATLWSAATLTPATLVGLLLGNAAAGRVSETLFRRAVLLFLSLTAATLLGRALWRQVAG